MTWASTSAYKGNKNIFQQLNWKSFVKKKRLLGVGEKKPLQQYKNKQLKT
jgi:hypothetical protein